MGCTASKSFEARDMEDWEDEDDVPVSKSFMRSLSMPLRQMKPQQQQQQEQKQGQKQQQKQKQASLSSSNLTTSNSSSSSSNSDHSGNLDVNHTVALTSTSYGALRMEEETTEGAQAAAHHTTKKLKSSGVAAEERVESTTFNDQSTAPLPAVPEAEVIDVSTLMRDLNGDEPWPAPRKRRKNRQLNRSISSVGNMRELDLKIRALALSLPNLEEKMRALDALQSIVISRKEQKKITGLFYGKTLPLQSSPSHSRADAGTEQLYHGSCGSLSPSSMSTSSSSSLASMTLDQRDQDEATSRWDLSKRMSSKVCHIEDEQEDHGEEVTSREVVADGNADKDGEGYRNYTCPPRGEHRAVLYITSLRGIRKTFEDCNIVRMILRGYGVAIDERDVSMHSEFRQELKDLVSRISGGPANVPRLFIQGKYIGGAEEVAALNEAGRVAELVAKLPKVQNGDVGCEGCGGARFVPCSQCCGSCKVVLDEDVVRCDGCNENGLVRCPVCL